MARYKLFLGNSAAGGGGGVDDSVTLTGVGGTGSVNGPTITASVEVALTGISATGAVTAPAVGAGATVDLTGISATGAVTAPTITSSVEVTLGSISATGSVTAMVAGAPDDSVTLGGVSATGAVNAPTVAGNADVTLTGISATGSVGTLTVTSSVEITLGGISATGSVNGPEVTTPGASVDLVGIGGTGSVGTITVTGDRVADEPAGGWALYAKAKRKRRQVESERLEAERAKLAEEVRAAARGGAALAEPDEPTETLRLPPLPAGGLPSAVVEPAPELDQVAQPVPLAAVPVGVTVIDVAAAPVNVQRINQGRMELAAKFDAELIGELVERLRKLSQRTRRSVWRKTR